MPKITYLKEIDGALWARLELDLGTKDGAVHIFTDKEIQELKDGERRRCLAEIMHAGRQEDYD